MPVPFPACRWPESLEERGPPEDPAILLTGGAHLGDTPVQIVAIRVDEAERRRLPGYRKDIDGACYEDEGLDAILETILEEMDCVAVELEGVWGAGQSRIIELAQSPYKVWLIPTSFEP